MQKRNANQKNQNTEQKAPGKKRLEVTFALECNDAKTVFIAGDFNDWSTTSLPMIRHESGRWEKRLALPQGRFEYKFFVDGTWIRYKTPNAMPEYELITWATVFHDGTDRIIKLYPSVPELGDRAHNLMMRWRDYFFEILNFCDSEHNLGTLKQWNFIELNAEAKV